MSYIYDNSRVRAMSDIAKYAAMSRLADATIEITPEVKVKPRGKKVPVLPTSRLVSTNSPRVAPVAVSSATGGGNLAPVLDQKRSTPRPIITANDIIAMVKSPMIVTELKLPDAITISCEKGHVHDYAVGNIAQNTLKCVTCAVTTKFPKDVCAIAGRLTGGPFVLKEPREGAEYTFTRTIGNRVVNIICRSGVGPSFASGINPLVIILHAMSTSKITSVLRAYFSEHGIIGVQRAPPTKKDVKIIARQSTKETFEDVYCRSIFSDHTFDLPWEPSL